MVQENIAFIKSMVAGGQPAYNILSFICDTVDTMRTGLATAEMDAVQKQEFLKAAGELVSALDKLDRTIGAG